MRRWILRIAVLAFVVCLGAVPIASGQAGAAEAVAVGGMDVQVWPEAEPGQTVVIASVTLDEKTPLPATVRIPVVEGMQLQWVGEISGGDPSQDPTRTYTVAAGEGGDVVEFEVSEFRLAQVEMLGLPVTAQGEITSVDFEWVQSAPATITAFSVRTVAGARDVEIDPAPVGAPETNQQGEALYTLPSRDLKPGDTAQVSVRYASGTEFEGGLDGTGDTNVVLAVLLGGVVVAMIVLVWALRRQRQA